MPANLRSEAEEVVESIVGVIGICWHLQTFTIHASSLIIVYAIICVYSFRQGIVGKSVYYRRLL